MTKDMKCRTPGCTSLGKRFHDGFCSDECADGRVAWLAGYEAARKQAAAICDRETYHGVNDHPVLVHQGVRDLIRGEILAMQPEKAMTAKTTRPTGPCSASSQDFEHDAGKVPPFPDPYPDAAIACPCCGNVTTADQFANAPSAARGPITIDVLTRCARDSSRAWNAFAAELESITREQAAQVAKGDRDPLRSLELAPPRPADPTGGELTGPVQRCGQLRTVADRAEIRTLGRLCSRSMTSDDTADHHTPATLAVADLRDLPALLGVEQTAQIAGVSDRTVRRWLAAGLIRAHRMPGTTRIRIKRDELLTKMGLLEATA